MIIISAGDEDDVQGTDFMTRLMNKARNKSKK